MSEAQDPNAPQVADVFPTYESIEAGLEATIEATTKRIEGLREGRRQALQEIEIKGAQIAGQYDGAINEAQKHLAQLQALRHPPKPAVQENNDG